MNPSNSNGNDNMTHQEYDLTGIPWKLGAPTAPSFHADQQHIRYTQQLGLRQHEWYLPSQNDHHRYQDRIAQ